MLLSTSWTHTHSQLATHPIPEQLIVGEELVLNRHVGRLVGDALGNEALVLLMLLLLLLMLLMVSVLLMVVLLLLLVLEISIVVVARWSVLQQREPTPKGEAINESPFISQSKNEARAVFELL